jgi:uncharacterized protein YjdB
MRIRHLIICICAATATACSSDNSSGGATPPIILSSQVASVVISPVNVLLARGDTVRLIAATRDISGAPLVGRRVVWSSEFPAVVTVSESGLVTAIIGGSSSRITAQSEGASGTATVTTGN